MQRLQGKVAIVTGRRLRHRPGHRQTPRLRRRQSHHRLPRQRSRRRRDCAAPSRTAGGEGRGRPRRRHKNGRPPQAASTRPGTHSAPPTSSSTTRAWRSAPTSGIRRKRNTTRPDGGQSARTVLPRPGLRAPSARRQKSQAASSTSARSTKTWPSPASPPTAAARAACA